MSSIIEKHLNLLREDFVRLRGDPEHSPDASIIIPVNANGDLETVFIPLGDIAHYTGKYTFEIILVINNYDSDNPPAEINQFFSHGIRVVSVPNARRPGEVVIVSARALGVRAAKSNSTIHFDADCKIPNINALLDWYVKSFNSGAGVAYSQVGFYDFKKIPSVYVKIKIHHMIRWLKRNIFGIPTTRGSNYAIARSLFLQLYDAAKLSVDLHVGPAAKLTGAKVLYSGHPNLRVLTSGRKFRGGWLRIFKYLRYRLRYNLKAIPTKRRQVTHTSWNGFDQESDRRVTTSPKKLE